MPLAVQALVLDGARVQLARRCGPGYHDGELGLPAGHVDGGEPLRAGQVRRAAPADVDDLPTDTVDHVAAAIAAWRAGETLLERGWSGDEFSPRPGSPRRTDRNGEGKDGRGVGGLS